MVKNLEISKAASISKNNNKLVPSSGSGYQKFPEKTYSKDKINAGQKYDIMSYFDKDPKAHSKRDQEKEFFKDSAAFDKYAKENRIEFCGGNNRNNLPHNPQPDPNIRNISNNLNTKINNTISTTNFNFNSKNITGDKKYIDIHKIRATNDILKTNNILQKIPGSDGSFLFDHLNIDPVSIDSSKFKDPNKNSKLQGLINNKDSSFENKMPIDCEVFLDKEKSYDLDNPHSPFIEKNTNNGNSHILPSKISYKQEDPYRLIKFSPEEIYEKVLDFKFYKNKEINENTQFIIPESFTSGNHYKYIWIVNFLFEMKHALLSAKIENSEKSKYRGENVKIALHYRNEIADTKVIVYTVLATKSLNFHKNKIFKENDIFAIYQEEDLKKGNTKPGNIGSEYKYQNGNKNEYDFTLSNNNNLPYFIGVVSYERGIAGPKSNDFICRVNRDCKSLIKEDCQYSVQLLGNLTTCLREYFSIIKMNELVLSEALLNPKLFYSQNQIQRMNCNDNGNEIDNIFFPGFNQNTTENKLITNKSQDNSKSFVQKIMNSSFFNKSQKEAIYKTSQLKSKDIFLIQGPPGTGKTHTIIGILSLFFIQNPTARIIICAPSNNAVDEIAIRLANIGLLDINLNYFTPEFIRFGLFDREDKDKENDTKSMSINSENLNILQKFSLEKLIENRYMEKEKLINDKLGKYKIQIEEASNKLDKCYAKIDELKSKSNSSGILTPSEREDLIQKYQKGIDKYYHIKKDLKSQKENLTLEKKDTTNHKKFYEKQLLERTRILCTTLSSAGNERIKSHNINYDYMILDEACQCVEPSALIPLQLGVKKVIMVGDHMQLPATVFSDKASLLRYNRSYFERLIENQYKKNHILTIQYRMHANIRNFIGKTFYEEKLQDDENSQKKLNDSVLYQLISEKHNFSMFDLKNSQEKLEQSSKSYININEAKFVVNLLISIQGTIEENNKALKDDFIDYFNNEIEGDMDKKASNNKKNTYLKYAIISPYKAQVKLLREEISKYCYDFLPMIEVNTVDSFQGREQDIVIISTVRSNYESNHKAGSFNSIGFLNDYRRMNVALSRGKLACFVVGSAKALIHNEYWKKLIEYCLNRDSLFSIRDSYFKFAEGIHPLNKELILNLLKTGKPFKITRGPVVKNKQLEEGEVVVCGSFSEILNSIGSKSENGKLNIDFEKNLDMYQDDIKELKNSIESFKIKKENSSSKFENKLQGESKLLSRKTNPQNNLDIRDENYSAKRDRKMS